MQSPDISVVAPVRNGERFLPVLFAALERQTLAPERIEVVLVDDGSTDSSPELIEAWASRDPTRRRLVRSDGRGPARARNAGIRAARGRWIASTDCDIAPEPQWLEAALQTLKRTGAQAVEGAIDVLPSSADGTYLSAQTNLDGGRYMTGNMVYRRDLIERLGGFDERFEEQFLEDSDLGFRILDEGLEIPFAPNARVQHPIVTQSIRAVLSSTRKTQWFALFAAKHPQRYRSELLPLVRPLTATDVHILLGIGAAIAATRVHGPARLAAFALAAKGLRHATIDGLVLKDLPRAPERLGIALGIPVARAFWLLVGCIRFRRIP